MAPGGDTHAKMAPKAGAINHVVLCTLSNTSIRLLNNHVNLLQGIISVFSPKTDAGRRVGYGECQPAVAVRRRDRSRDIREAFDHKAGA
jgi:hypothetical protein